MTPLRSFQEVVRTVTVGYPIPFVLCALIAFSMFCFSAALLRQDSLAWALFGIGCLPAVVGCGILVFAVVRRPELLRSERFGLINRYLDALSDSDMTDIMRDRLGKVINGFAEEPGPRRAENYAEGSQDDEENSSG